MADISTSIDFFETYDFREEIINADGVPVLVAFLAAGSPFQKEKAARVMENLAIKEQHADRIVDAGVEHALKSIEVYV